MVQGGGGLANTYMCSSAHTVSVKFLFKYLKRNLAEVLFKRKLSGKGFSVQKLCDGGGKQV